MVDVKKTEKQHTYVAIDLKSFYASVECVARGLDPLKTNLLVADASRTEKTICLAVSPSLKAYGISGRARLFEAVQRIKEVNADRKFKLKERDFSGESYDAETLKEDESIKVDFIVAPPQMSLYEKVSSEVYNIYLKYVSEADVHVYSIDEVFMDVTQYMEIYKLSAHELTMKMIHEVLDKTGITATAGIGTNMYLAKIAMDIVAKHMPADKDGVRIAELDEMSYRKRLWSHRPLTDFWRVGRGYAKKLEANGLYTMGDIARCSLGKEGEFYNADLLYKMFGINAELLIDHAWGYEPCTIDAIKNYHSETKSISTGQVLSSPYDFEKGKLIIREMTDLLVLDLLDKRVVTDQMVLNIGYDVDNLTDPKIKSLYHGQITTDHYGRYVPKPAHGSINLPEQTSSARMITEAVMQLYDRIVDKNLLVRRMNVVANNVVHESRIKKDNFEQMTIFGLMDDKKVEEETKKESLEKERKAQEAVLKIKKKFGKNAVLRGMNLLEGGTTIERNGQIGGHKA